MNLLQKDVKMMKIVNSFEKQWYLPYSYIGLDDNEKYSLKDLAEKVESLTCDLVSLTREYEEYRQCVEDNYVRISVEKQVGIDWSDFI